MTHYAPYDPDGSRTEGPLDAVIRPATPVDIDGLAAIDLNVVVRTAEDWSRAIDKTVAGERLLLVAEIDGSIAAFAQAQHLDQHPVDNAPAGYYLTGVTVLPTHRRAGLAHDLTVARLGWIAERADQAWYFAGAENAASIRLHERLGFIEESRAPSIHGVAFNGGEGVLFRLPLDEQGSGSAAGTDR